MPTTIVLFTRDLRVHDHPALHAAATAGEVVPLFVFDEHPLRTFGGVNRLHFLLESLEDLRTRLRKLGGDLWVRRGNTVDETIKLAREVSASAIHVTTDASTYARHRLALLDDAGEIELRSFPGIAAVEPGALTPDSGDHYRVFTPYLRAWAGAPKREVLDAPKRIRTPPPVGTGVFPSLRELSNKEPSSGIIRGGESKGRERAAVWLSDGVGGYNDLRDDLAADATSRLSAYLHFGCVSPLELVADVPRGKGGDQFVRQLCWRDFFLQVLAATPGYARSDYKQRTEQWVEDSDALERWKHGLTGVPLVDAGMRQLVAEGWMHNRARLVTASFLTRRLNIDWRKGGQHFWELLVDGDLASNAGNWQWVAGTGNATRTNAAMNPIRQAKRFDRGGDFVRRYVPELADLEAPTIHEPWRLGESALRKRGYPMPLNNRGSGLTPSSEGLERGSL
jgi:deoxyribodipyrimidine photo-lyase